MTARARLPTCRPTRHASTRRSTFSGTTPSSPTTSRSAPSSSARLMAVPGDPGAPREHPYPRWLIGWMSGTDLPPWFWIKNTGLFWPLLLLALLSPLALRGRARLLIAPFSLVFLAANLVKFQPWDWDNSKLLVFWYMASAVAVGALLVRLARAHLLGGVAAAAIWLSLVASGVLSLMP